METELELVKERRRVLELEQERQGLESEERRLLETKARNQRIASLWEDSPYPNDQDGVDFNQVSAAKRLFESRSLYEAYGSYDYLDIIGPGGYASTWGQPLGYGMQSYMNPLSTRVDRAQGRDRPFVITEIDLGFIRGVARIVCEINCPAKGAIRNLVNYTVGGKGFQYAVALKNQKNKVPDGLVEAVQDVVDEFLQRVKWSGALGAEGELVRRWFRDGEYFLASHCDRVGRTDVRFIEPEQITEQGSEYWTRETLADYGIDIGQMDIDRTFGILTPKHDVNSRVGYNAWFDDLAQSDLFPAESLQHFKLSDRNIKRGISDFYGAVKWLQRSDSLLTKTAGGAAIQAAIAGIRKHAAGVTKSDVDAFRASKTDFSTTAYMPGGSSRTFNNYSYPDGTILDIGFGLDWVDPPQGADRGPAFVEVAQGLLRWVATQWSMPEFMISGDASNANFSSTLVSEAPFVKNVQGLQFGFGAMWHDLIWRVIYNAARYGRFDRFGDAASYFSLQKLLKVHISYPTIETRNRDQETGRLKILSDDGIISPATRAAEEGYDLAEEQAKGAKQQVSEITGTAKEPPGDESVPESAGAVSPGAFADVSAFNPHGAGLVDVPKRDKVLQESAADLRAAIKSAAAATNRDPSDGQKASGNYSKGRFRWNGLTIVLETPKGATRSGVDADGNEWSIRMPNHYGYISRTQSEADGDHIDVFVGPHPESDQVFVVDQKRPDGAFDEHKVMIGFLNKEEAREGYLAAYSPGWNGLGAITAMTLQQFNRWLASGNTAAPISIFETTAGSVNRGRLYEHAMQLVWGAGATYP